MFRDRDVSSSLFWILIGILFSLGGLHYGIRRSGIPGPGFLPFVTGLILVALSLTLLITRLVNKRDGGDLAIEPMPRGEALKSL